uniref:Reverse transcriptase Ty1/copia-type domain-containing protein n=1 Tax=Fagus sylvatica TaxID=28930 RepID=A0A2N9IH28_FAGSY
MVSEPTIMDPVANNSSPLLLLNNMSNLMSIKLDSVNYMIWKLQLSAILDAYSMIEHLDGSTQQPRQFLVNETGLWWLDQPLLKKFGTGWKRNSPVQLEQMCFNLKLELQGIKKGNESINSYLQRIKSTRDKLSAVGVLVDNEELLHMVLKGLPKEFAPFAFAIRTRDDTISFEKLSVLLQTEEQSMSESSDPFPNSALAMFVSNNQKPHTRFQWKVSLVVKATTEEGVEETLPIVAEVEGLLAHIHLIPVLLNHRCHRATDHITSNASSLNTPTPYHGSEQVTCRHVLFNETGFPGLHTSDQSNSSPQITAFSSDIWLNTLHTLHCCAHNQAPILTVLDNIPTLPPTLHTDTPSFPSASVLPHSPNQSPVVPISVSCHDSRFTALTPDTIILSTHPSESTLLPNEPSTITSDTSLPISQHPMQSKSKKGIYKPKLGYAAQIDYTLTEPSSYKAAAQHPQWCTAMQDEFDALQKQGTWSLVTPLPNKNVVGCKWLYKLKHNSDRTIARYKARLIAKGFHQQQGVDFGETFSLVIKPPIVRLILSLAGYIDSTHPHHVCRLHKSIYGLKQAPRAWFESFTTQLLHLGFIASTADSSLFIYHHQQVIAYLLLYVDDIVLTSNSPSFLDHLILQLRKVFDLKDLGALHYFLGFQVSRTSDALHVTQSKYASDLLIKHHMVDSKPTKTPCSPNTRLSLHDSDLLSDPHGYRSLVGALHYLTFTRPDISFAVHQVCQYMTTPTSTHLTAAKRVLRYIKGTLYHGIAFTPGPLSLSVFSNADWAGDPDDRRSTSVSRSSTESEYRALATTSAEVCWIRTLLKAIGIYLSQPPILWCDNVSALAIASNPVFHARTKHIEVDFHFIRERVLHKDLVVKFVSTTDQLADIFTKSLPTQRFIDLCRNLTVSLKHHSIMGE